MQSGSLRHRIDIQAQTQGQDSSGFPTASWATVATVWGQISALRGTERVLAAQVQAAASHRVTLRFYAGLTTKHRLQYSGRTFNITFVNNVDERGISQEVDVLEIIGKVAE